MDQLLDIEDSGESLVFAAVALYPQTVKKLIEKAAKQNLNAVLRKSYFSGY